jgi:hypothetical protein
MYSLPGIQDPGSDYNLLKELKSSGQRFEAQDHEFDNFPEVPEQLGVGPILDLEFASCVADLTKCLVPIDFGKQIHRRILGNLTRRTFLWLDLGVRSREVKRTLSLTKKSTRL